MHPLSPTSDRADAEHQLLRLEACTVDLRALRVIRRDGVVALTRLEARLLLYLARHADRPIGRDELLREVWGYREGIRTRTIENTVLRLRRKIERQPGRPRHILSLYGVGYRFEPLPGVVLPDVARGSVPEPATTFVGRETELALLDELVDTEPIVTVVGLYGVGRSRLVTEALRRALPRHDAAFLVDVRTAAVPQDVARAASRAIGEVADGDAVTSVGRALARRRRVLLGLIGGGPAVAQAVASWALLAPDARFVVTGDAPVPRSRAVRLHGLPEADAVRLLIDRGRAARPTFEAHDADTLAAIVDRVDGHPFAIERLARRANVLSLGQLLQRLHRAPLSVVGPTDAGPSLGDELDRVVAGLPPVEREALEAAARLGRDFDLVDLERVAGDGADRLLDGLAALQERALLAARLEGDSVVYRLPRLLAAALTSPRRPPT